MNLLTRTKKPTAPVHSPRGLALELNATQCGGLFDVSLAFDDRVDDVIRFSTPVDSILREIMLGRLAHTKEQLYKIAPSNGSVRRLWFTVHRDGDMLIENTRREPLPPAAPYLSPLYADIAAYLIDYDGSWNPTDGDSLKPKLGWSKDIILEQYQKSVDIQSRGRPEAS